MRVISPSALVFLLLLPTLFVTPASASLTLGEKAALQAAMQRHIDRVLVDGVYLDIDFPNREVRKLHPNEAHPLIVQFGDYYVLCSEFLNDAGDAINVDFYLAPRGRSFSVFQALVNDREGLKKWIRAGSAKVVR